MKVIIAGSREGISPESFLKALDLCSYDISEIVQGGARGVDAFAKVIAEEFDVPCKEFPANWEKYKNGAGHIRNREMAEYADALFAIWDGVSPGTKNMITVAKELGLHVTVVVIGPSGEPRVL